MTEAPRIYTLNQVAEQLSIGISLTRALVASGEIKSFRIGNLVKVHEDDLRAFIDARRNQS